MPLLLHSGHGTTLENTGGEGGRTRYAAAAISQGVQIIVNMIRIFLEYIINCFLFSCKYFFKNISSLFSSRQI